jgi:thioredoxin-like negative regulator of GroEL
MAIDSETVTLLAELGFIAGDRGMAGQAEAIAAGLVAMRPESAEPHLVRAYCRLGARDAEGAVRILREDVLAAHPENAAGKAMLGLALHMAGKGTERDQVLQEVIEAGGDDHAVEIAKKLVGAALPT